MKVGDLIICTERGKPAWDVGDRSRVCLPVFGIIIEDLGGYTVTVRWMDTRRACLEHRDIIMDPKEDWISLCE